MAKATKRKPIFVARCAYGIHTVTAYGETEKEAKDAVLEELDGPAQENGRSPAEFWEHMEGHVWSVKFGECEWL